jgi:hypothetical protein
MMDKYHPRNAFLGYAIIGFILGIFSFFLNKEAENEFVDGEIPEDTDWSSELFDGQTPSDA